MLPAEPERLLELGTLDVEGRLVVASNATFLCSVSLDDINASCVYKPVRGERPLWDFPHGTLAGREVATYQISVAGGFDLVPPTVMRADGPFGPGMCQLWIDHDEDGDLVDVVPQGEVPTGWLRVLDAYDGEGAEVSLVHADDEQLELLAAFDAVVNNADRKAGHVIVDEGGHLYGVDHGVCLHEEDKLRTVLWGWQGRPLPASVPPMLNRVLDELDGKLGASLSDLLHPDELTALRDRIHELLATGTHPAAGARRRAIPWPVF